MHRLINAVVWLKFLRSQNFKSCELIAKANKFKSVTNPSFNLNSFLLRRSSNLRILFIASIVRDISVTGPRGFRHNNHFVVPGVDKVDRSNSLPR